MISERTGELMAWCAAGCPLSVDATQPESATTDDCAGALIDPNGGAYLPWGPYLTSDDVLRMRAELHAAIDELAAREGWPHSHKDEILSLAMNGSAANLLHDLAHFSARLREQRAQVAAREALAARTWRGEGLDHRRA